MRTRSLHSRPPRALLAALAAAAFAGCTMGPDYRRPPVELPAGYNAPRAAAAAASAAATPATVASGPALPRLASGDQALANPPALQTGDKALLDTAWWSAFGDPQLDALIRTTLEQNKDLRISALRIEQLDAFLQVSKAAGLPQAGYEASRLRNTLSENRQVPLVVGAQPVDNAYSIGLAASWELDLWGRLGRADEAALAELVASEETRRAVAQSLVSEVAQAYVHLLTLDRELELLKATIASHRETIKLAESRFNNGGSSEMPVVAAVAAMQALLPQIPMKEAEIAALENQLNELAGREPGPVPRGKPLGALALPKVPGGLPADLLAQRPDVRRAEQELISANAKIGIAKAQYLPQISLTASSGFASNELSKLTQLSSNFGSFGVNLLGPIFSSGRISGQVREAEAAQKQAAIAFLKSVQTALYEVEGALTTHGKVAHQLALRAVHVETLREQVRLAQRRFDGGQSGYFEVLEAERGLNAGLVAQNQAQREQFASLIAIYKAMGGGWSLPDITAPRAPTPKLDND